MRQIIHGILLIAALFLLGCTSSIPEDTQSPSTNIEGLDVGNLPPDFKITSIDGKPVHLRSLGENGKPVVVYFFATWCPHCRNDFNALSNVYQEYQNDIDFIAMSLDLKENENKISSYIANYPNLAEVKFAPGTQKILSDYNVRYTTTKYAINKEGHIIYRGSGEITEAQWRILLEELRKV